MFERSEAPTLIPKAALVRSSIKHAKENVCIEFACLCYARPTPLYFQTRTALMYLHHETLSVGVGIKTNALILTSSLQSFSANRMPWPACAGWTSFCRMSRWDTSSSSFRRVRASGHSQSGCYTLVTFQTKHFGTFS